MGITRRNTIIGLGVLAGSAGLIGGSGAFDSVEAQRSFDVSVSGDAGGQLGITVTNDAIARTEESGAGDNEVIVFSLEADDSLNEDAVTTFFEVFDLTNNGSQDVEARLDLEDVEGLTFTVADDGDNLTDGVGIDVGETISVGLEVNTREGGYTEPEGGEPHQITIIAESDAAAE
ncbi:hypothetical protein [Natrarchaeobaculum sulfurireducens]|uniref:DUF1102 domain-containing protein n=1 Tax=Natrarchaeobaculum sulfurireducens TaxID=2044521 RepID=A0A346PJG4_9EURY|nr:hypothetical protein [Natrarchaeobaculum sulfurireducens]AXR79659.1 hypothetical protein AArc1_3361 [Natrarchaeobaculum sulfurireducens]AXR83402.1 hypothetical protein AArcMg_3423 [Natrarchaeobaculum sulfurireducens]